MSVTISRAVGAVLVTYTLLYTFQFGGVLYSDVLSSSDVYRVMNYFSAAGILVWVGLAWQRKKATPSSEPGRYLAAQAGFYVSLGLAIWYFTLWLRLLASEDGATPSKPDLVIWFFVSILIPMVLGTHGALLLKQSGKVADRS